MDQVKFVEESFEKILLGPFLNTLTKLILRALKSESNSEQKNFSWFCLDQMKAISCRWLEKNYLKYFNVFRGYKIGTLAKNGLKWWFYGSVHGQVTNRSFRCYRSSHRRYSKKKGALKNVPKFTGKHLCKSLFWNKVAKKRDSGTGVFLWIL